MDRFEFRAVADHTDGSFIQHIPQTLPSAVADMAFAFVLPRIILDNGVSGLLHVSQISYNRVEKPSDVLSIGEEITAKVVDFNSDAQKISLSMKALDFDDEIDQDAEEYEDEDVEYTDAEEEAVEEEAPVEEAVEEEAAEEAEAAEEE